MEWSRRRPTPLPLGVIITYREQRAAADRVVAQCSLLTPGAQAVEMDLTQEESVRAAFADRVVVQQRLDFLIANAAATALKLLLGLKMHQVDKTFAISVRHFLLMSSWRSIARGNRWPYSGDLRR